MTEDHDDGSDHRILVPEGPNGEPMPEEIHVQIHVPAATDDLAWAEQLADAVADRVEESEVGEFDGYVTGDGMVELHFFATSVVAMLAIARPALEDAGVLNPGTFAMYPDGSGSEKRMALT